MADEILTVETPEHVQLHFALATIGNRFLACAIDHLIQGILFILTSIIAYSLSDSVKTLSKNFGTGTNEVSLWIIALGLLTGFLVFFGYFVIFEMVWNGQTPGKRWMKLRVIQEDGRPISFFSSLSRNVIRLADIMPFPFYSVGMVSVFVNSRAKRLGDLVANTVVVKERSAEAPSFDEIFGDDVIDSAHRRIAPQVEFSGDVSIISQSEILTVESFLRRRYDIPERPRKWLAWRITTPLLEKIGPQYDQESFDFEGFLEELLDRYRRLPKYKSE